MLRRSLPVLITTSKSSPGHHRRLWSSLLAAAASSNNSSTSPIVIENGSNGCIFSPSTSPHASLQMSRRWMMTRAEWVDKRLGHARAIGFNPRDNTTKEFYEQYIDSLGVLGFFHQPTAWLSPPIDIDSLELPPGIRAFVTDTGPVDYEAPIGQMAVWQSMLDELIQLSDRKLICEILMVWSKLPTPKFSCFARPNKGNPELVELKHRFYNTFMGLLNLEDIRLAFSSTERVIELAILVTKMVAPWPEWILRHGNDADFSKLTNEYLLTLAWCYRLKKEIPAITAKQFQRELMNRFEKLTNEQICGLLDVFNRCRVTHLDRDTKFLIKNYANLMLKQTLADPNADWTISKNIFEPLLRVGTSRLSVCYREINELMETFKTAENKEKIPIATLAALCLNFCNCGVFDGKAADFFEDKLLSMDEFIGVPLEQLTEIITFIYESKFKVKEEVLRKMEDLMVNRLEEYRGGELNFSLSISRILSIMLPSGYHPQLKLILHQFESCHRQMGFSGQRDHIANSRIEGAMKRRLRDLEFLLLFYRYRHLDEVLAVHDIAFNPKLGMDKNDMFNLGAEQARHSSGTHRHRNVDVPFMQIKSAAERLYSPENVFEDTLPPGFDRRTFVIRLGEKDAKDMAKQNDGESTVHEKLSAFVVPKTDKWIAIMIMRHQAYWINKRTQLKVSELQRQDIFRQLGYECGMIHEQDLAEVVQSGTSAIEDLLYSTIKPEGADNDENVGSPTS